MCHGAYTAWLEDKPVAEASWIDDEERLQVASVNDGWASYTVVRRSTFDVHGNELEYEEILLRHEQAAWLRQAMTEALRAHAVPDVGLYLVGGPSDRQLCLFDDFLT